MPRPFIFPDPNDRSPNDPSIIVSPAQVLGVYNQQNEEKMERVTTKVQEWYCEKAQNTYNWDEAKFSGNQCILGVNLEKKSIPEE